MNLLNLVLYQNGLPAQRVSSRASLDRRVLVDEKPLGYKEADPKSGNFTPNSLSGPVVPITSKPAITVN